jgi:two-component system sensor histidine kinase CpxA
MRLPLYSKILLWFFLNLLIVGGAICALFIFQFRTGPEVLLGGRAGERLKLLAEVIMDEINHPPSRPWNEAYATETLARFSRIYHVQFLLYRNAGGQAAGKPTTLPPTVAERTFPPGALRRAGRPPRDGFGAGPEGEGPFDGPPDGGPEFRGPPRGGRDPGRVRDIFMARTDDPKHYWIGLRTSLNDRAPQPPGPATLIVMTDSLSAGGLLLDFKPLIWVGVGAVIFSVLFWLPMVGSITRSLAQMNLATGQIAEGKFDVRVSERRRDELGSLGAAINRMATRLTGFVTGQKRFTGDIAHELCSPIARMQMAVGILEERADPKDKQYVDDLREEVQHMSSLVNELLSFSKASLGATNIRLQNVALRPLVEKAVKRESREGADIRVEVPDDAMAMIDPELIVRAVSNLLRNAIHYAGTAGPITVMTNLLDGEIELVVADSGPGVPETELPKLFDPFYRVDVSRTRETGGVGLGLSIVKTCVETCHGSVTCRNRPPSGLEVIMRLPR